VPFSQKKVDLKSKEPTNPLRITCSWDTLYIINFYMVSRRLLRHSINRSIIIPVVCT